MRSFSFVHRGSVEVSLEKFAHILRLQKVFASKKEDEEV